MFLIPDAAQRSTWTATHPDASDSFASIQAFGERGTATFVTFVEE